MVLFFEDTSGWYINFHKDSFCVLFFNKKNVNLLPGVNFMMELILV